MVTRWRSGVYRLLSICGVYVKVRTMFAASECLLHCALKLFCHTQYISCSLVSKFHLYCTNYFLNNHNINFIAQLPARKLIGRYNFRHSRWCLIDCYMVQSGVPRRFGVHNTAIWNFTDFESSTLTFQHSKARHLIEKRGQFHVLSAIKLIIPLYSTKQQSVQAPEQLSTWW